jgi:hypothetical protein
MTCLFHWLSMILYWCLWQFTCCLILKFEDFHCQHDFEVVNNEVVYHDVIMFGDLMVHSQSHTFKTLMKRN